MESLNEFLIQKPRSLPVIIAIDRSGSMGENGKILALNIALQNFIESMKEEDSGKAELCVALYSFGGDSAMCDLPLTTIGQVNVPSYVAKGKTPLYRELNFVKQCSCCCRRFMLTTIAFSDVI